MKREDIGETKDAMAKVYREFSRQKYTKYKLQYPKMRESEIVSKIIKEWESLDSLIKDKFQRAFEQQKYLSCDDISESENSKKGLKKPSKALPKTAVKEPSTPKASTVKVYIEKPEPKHLEDSPLKPSEVDIQSIVDSDSAKKSLIIAKTKRIGKNIQPKNSDYIQFFKHYYELTSRQHPKWLPHQISAIVKLLWKKRKNQIKVSKNMMKKRKPSTKPPKILSGRRYFRKVKQLTANEAANIWKTLPKESRIRYCKEAKGIQKIKKHNFAIHLSSQKEIDREEKEVKGNSLYFLYNVMSKT